jgi:hypothetical protein
MNKLRPLALLCAGPVSRSSLAKLPQLRRNLVWVKSTSYRVASRAVNALGAGTPVSEFSEIDGAAVWLVSVPPEEVEWALKELQNADLEWRRRVLLIIDRDTDSDAAASFRHCGAAVASLAPIDADGSRYITEGDTDAVRIARWLAGDTHKRVVMQIKKGAKAKYLAGAHAATKQVLPLIAEAMSSFQAAGLSNADAKSLTETLVSGAVRLYFRAGRRSLKL